MSDKKAGESRLFCVREGSRGTLKCAGEYIEREKEHLSGWTDGLGKNDHRPDAGQAA